MMTRRDALALPLVSLAPGGILPRLAVAADDADPTAVFTGGKKPTDARLGPPKTLDDYFPFVVPKTKEAWEARKKELREQILVANGLWPLPEKTPLNPVVHGKTDRDGYTIEKVFLASTPGHYVSGNLYRPLPSETGGSRPPLAQKLPGVLFAHGHWKDGRLHDAGEKAAARDVKSGGEPDLARGRFFMQAIPVTLARLGFVVFQYDMVGVADSTALPHAAGFADAAGELRLQSAMGLQTWNSLRALDFLLSLPDVDPNRVGMTGASGGGTQTFITAALDDRLAAAFPAVMVSTGMQGGCVCENCSGLRVGTGNVEIIGTFAPKPLALSAANDWTKELMTKGFPELKQLYKLYGAEDQVAARAWLEYDHQYNVHARRFMYAWFMKHLRGKDGEVGEPAFEPTPPEKLRVYDEQHPRPKDELDAKGLRAALAKASDERMAKLAPTDAKSLEEFKRVVGTALRVMCHSQPPAPGMWHATYSDRNAEFPGGVRGLKGHIGQILRPGPEGAPDPAGRDYLSVPFVHLLPKTPSGRTAVWVHPAGKASLFADGKLAPAAAGLLAAGVGVLAIDVLGTGEMVGRPLFPAEPKGDPAYAGYVYGYNPSLLASRVRDVFTAAEHARTSIDGKPVRVDLVGWGEMGPVAVLAKALAGDKVAKLAADLNRFRFEDIKDPADPMMLPGAVKYGGLGAFLALCAPGEVLVHNHAGTGTGKLPQAAYAAAGAADKLARSAEKLDDAKVVEWLVK
ncbi:MAG: acetylxylan esterase [Gemmataceae bacterium]|nr:acetylxylan esterase [Gemmataceae bacterium]